MIPATLIRSVPEHPDEQQERLWRLACDMHPDWRHVTYRDPIDPAGFPITSPHWRRCLSGAQLAGLVRLEALWAHGGIWLDSDVELHRHLGPLLQCSAFAAWEDLSIVPDAVLGAEPEHPAIGACLDLAIARITGDGKTWRDDRGAWSTGPGVTTTVLPGRDDVLLLGPDSFYPIHYVPRETLADRIAAHNPAPWTFGTHLWAWSWR